MCEDGAGKRGWRRVVVSKIVNEEEVALGRTEEMFLLRIQCFYADFQLLKNPVEHQRKRLLNLNLSLKFGQYSHVSVRATKIYVKHWNAVFARVQETTIF